MEEDVALSSTGQLVASVVVRTLPDTHKPVMMIQTPIGLYLPAGLSLQIDNGKAMPIPLDTCGPQGCFAEMQISPDLLSALKAGKRLSITYQNSAKNNVVVPLVLDNFGESFQKIQ
jgi:invasion protein IalB